MHDLVDDLRKARGTAAVRRWFRGFALPFRALALLRRHRSLWPWAAAPALIGLLLFAGVAGVALAYADEVLRWWWTPPEAQGLGTSLLVLVWGVLYVVLLVLGLAGAYLSALIFGGVVASPFNDALSIRVEAILAGNDRPKEASLLVGLGRSLLSTAAVTGVYLLLAVPVLLLNLVPAVGPPVATVLHAGLAAYFLAIEYADVALARYGLPWREKLALIRRHRALASGFGLSISLLFWIPFLNLLVMPIAVTAGTALGLAVHDGKRRV